MGAIQDAPGALLGLALGARLRLSSQPLEAAEQDEDAAEQRQQGHRDDDLAGELRPGDRRDQAGAGCENGSHGYDQ